MNVVYWIGSHVSIRNGYSGAARTAHALGANAFQYFPKNPRSVTIKSFDPQDAEACASYCRQHDIRSIAHAPYPINLAAESADRRDLQAESLLNDLTIAEACGSVGLVVHFGIYKEKGKDRLQGYKNIIQCLNQVIARWSGSAQILIENQAGDGDMGTTFEELTQVRSLTDAPNRIGFCFDTCHAFASGIWNGRNWQELLEKGTKLGYFEHLRAIHLNDCQYPSGSKKDRHARVGDGFIGAEPIAELLRSSFAAHIPIVLETPYDEDGTHRGQIAQLRRLAE